MVYGDGTGAFTVWDGMSGRFRDENLGAFNLTKGVIAMANYGPDSNGCQFFITTEVGWGCWQYTHVYQPASRVNFVQHPAQLRLSRRPARHLSPHPPRHKPHPPPQKKTQQPAPSLDGQYQVFGRVLKGMELVDAVSHIEVNEREAPVMPVTVKNTGEILIRQAPGAGEVRAAEAGPAAADAGVVLDADAVAAALEAAGAPEPVKALPSSLQVPGEAAAAADAAAPAVTQLVYFDLEQAGTELGRVVFGL